jgi:sugar phosphate isomerase/epimerase
MSVIDAASPQRREFLYNCLLNSMEQLTAEAAKAGIGCIQVECTPLIREIPYSIEQSQRFMESIKERCSIPVKLLIDIGHALYQPLYGQSIRMEDWLNGLKGDIGAFHLQNTDFQSDSHWGWPDERGVFDAKGFARQVYSAGLQNMPCFLEVVYPFELDDNVVLSNIISSVEHCKGQFENI